jgi:hypothetical protein
MFMSRPRIRPLWVALLAVVGTVSVADVASACTREVVAPAPRACCAERPPSECGCCSPGEAPSSGAPSHADAIVSPTADPLLRASMPSCECRANEPAAPAERPAQRTSTERPEVEGVQPFAALDPAPRRPSSHAPLLLPNESPPKTPLYLRTSRLLI